MKKLILAVVLYAASMGLASASAMTYEGDAAARGGPPLGVEVYVRGGFNLWGLVDPMVWDQTAQTYVAEIQINVGSYEFRVASEDWSTVDLGNIDRVDPFSPPATRNVTPDCLRSLLLAT